MCLKEKDDYDGQAENFNCNRDCGGDTNRHVHRCVRYGSTDSIVELRMIINSTTSRSGLRLHVHD
jgi:hypothetical protein